MHCGFFCLFGAQSDELKAPHQHGLHAEAVVNPTESMHTSIAGHAADQQLAGDDCGFFFSCAPFPTSASSTVDDDHLLDDTAASHPSPDKVGATVQALTAASPDADEQETYATVPNKRIWELVRPDWVYVAIGVAAAAVLGTILPFESFLLSTLSPVYMHDVAPRRMLRHLLTISSLEYDMQFCSSGDGGHVRSRSFVSTTCHPPVCHGVPSRGGGFHVL